MISSYIEIDSLMREVATSHKYSDNQLTASTGNYEMEYFVPKQGTFSFRMTPQQLFIKVVDAKNNVVVDETINDEGAALQRVEELLRGVR